MTKKSIASQLSHKQRGEYYKHKKVWKGKSVEEIRQEIEKREKVYQSHWIYIDKNGIAREVWSKTKKTKRAADNWVIKLVRSWKEESGGVKKFPKDCTITYHSYKTYPAYKT